MRRPSPLVSAVAAAGITAGVVGGCSSLTDAQKQDAKSMGDIASRFQNGQPIPSEPWSQYRQTLIDAEVAQMRGTQTTSFWFSRGAGGQGTPIGTCPSLGFPVPASAQLSNPLAPVLKTDGSSTGVAVGQMEPNGVYTGDTAGTFVVCAGSGGKPYLTYVEADVVTVGGPAEWRDGKVQPTGAPTVAAGVKK